MILNQRRGWTVGDVIAASTVVFAVLSVLVTLHSDALDWVDRTLGRIPQHLSADHDWIGSFWLWVGRVSQPTNVMILAAGAVLVLLAFQQFRAAIFTVVSIGGTDLLNRGLKQLVERDRPTWDHPVQVLHSYSFPSSHSAVIAAGAGVAIVLATQLLEPGRARSAATWTAVVIALVVGADRIFLGVHNPSDVIAGYIVGEVVVLVTLALSSRRPKREWGAPAVPDTIRA